MREFKHGDILVAEGAPKVEVAFIGNDLTDEDMFWGIDFSKNQQPSPDLYMKRLFKVKPVKVTKWFAILSDNLVFHAYCSTKQEVWDKLRNAQGVRAAESAKYISVDMWVEE